MKQSAESCNLVLDNKFCLSGAGTLDSVYRISTRDLLGDMYDKYTKFKIVLNSSLWQTSANPSTANWNMCKIHMSGLNWINSSYGTNTTDTSAYTNITYANTSLQMTANNSEAIYPTFMVLPGNTNPYYYNHPESGGLVFSCPTLNNIDLRINFRNVAQNKPPPYPAGSYQIYIFSFTIYGLYED